MEFNPYQTPAANLQGTESFGTGTDTSKAVLAVLVASRQWVRVCGVVFMIFCLAAIAIILLPKIRPGGGAITGVEITVIVIVSAINGLMSWKLLAYASGITKLSQSEKIQDLDDALEHHRGFWLTIGTLVAVYAILVVAGLILVAVRSEF